MGDHPPLRDLIRQTRRPPVKRDKSGLPAGADRCQFSMQDPTQLYPRLCYRPRARGSAYCWQHPPEEGEDLEPSRRDVAILGGDPSL